MVQFTKKSVWAEAASSAFAIASVMPSALDSTQISEVYQKVEDGENICEQYTNVSDLSSLRNASGESLLIVACKSGNLPVVNYLLAESDVDDTDNDGWSPLLNASFHGHLEIVRLLLEAGATVDQPDLMGWTPLMWSVYKNFPQIVELLLIQRAHVNLIDEEDGLTPLIVSSGRGFTDVVRKLLDSDAQVNACDKFGSTALIWAARKGHLPVCQLLLNAGAEVDAVGMYSSTALMLATRGNYFHVVELLLSREPNINVVDQNGLSALSIAAREGYADIADSLIKSGAFVNQCDRFGNWILASAVRSGNVMIVRMLLDKFADVNSRDSENRTALHLAIDKSYMDIVLLLLERKPNLELKNKDGETPLLRAVKSRHVALCDLLVKAGAKISATDNAGDNALHLALRARSRRLATTLLTNPSDSRLLYRPNKLGQTPYSIDQQNPQPILPLIFGPVDAEQHMDAMLGYDVYSNVLADILCEPSLQLPLTMGLYAKWGSGKSVLLQKMKDSIRSFSRSWLDGVQLRWSNPLIAYLFFTMLILTLSVATVVSITGNPHLLMTVGIMGAVMFVILFASYAVVYYGSEVRCWSRSMRIARSIARALAHIKLLFNVVTLYAPGATDKDMVSNPVSFLFADYHRLSSIGGEQALAKIVTTLFEAAETHFGVLPVRFYCALRGSSYYGALHTGGSLRRHCGVPIVLIGVAAVVSAILFESFLIGWLFSDRDLSSGASSYLFVSIVFFVVFLLMISYPLYLALRYATTNVPKRRVNAAARAVHKLRFEGLMQKLQTEVDLLADMIHTLDAFTNSQTRLVVVVDGLDNCEQERMVQTLDALELLFSARKNRPFIVVIAVDPHIIISAISHNMHSALSGTELTGHDYLKNIVNMPFYLHNSALRQLQNKLKEKRETFMDWKERFRRQDTFHGSHLSLREADTRPSITRKPTLIVGTRNVGESLMADDYFSSINPRAMRRIVNALTLTGRLMRAFEIEFSWLCLGHWVSMVEQWPSRMCWLIDHALQVKNPQMTLYEIYNQLKEHIPKEDPLMKQDRNPENFETFLQAVADQGNADQLTVSHVRRFVPCTSNLDPYLRKLIREKREGIDFTPMVTEQQSIFGGHLQLPPNAKHLFSDQKVWASVEVSLVEMRIDDVVNLVKRLDIAPTRLDSIVEKFRALNLNGLVLSTCHMSELQQALGVTLGDWTLIRMLIETLKGFGINVPGARVDKRITSVLREEEEELEEEEADGETVRQQSVSMLNGALPAGAPIDSFEEKRRSNRSASIAVMNSYSPGKRRSTVLASDISIDNQHRALMASLAGMDLVETEGDLPDGPASTPSVRFDDDGAATSADSTESRFGSSENLLDVDDDEEPMLSRQPSSTRLRSSYMNNSRYRRLSRSELMRRVHGDSIHSDGAAPRGSGGSGNGGVGNSRTSSFLGSVSGDEEHQLTVLRRDEPPEVQEREPLKDLFKRQDIP